jgi:hypothetical protein
VQRIGCAGCAGPELFANVAGLTFDAGGALWLIDNGEPFLRVFDASGRNRLATGRKGKGPAEFNTPFFIAVRADSTAQVADIVNRRLTVLDARGVERNVIPIPGFLVAVDHARAPGFTWLVTTDFRTPALLLQRLDNAAAAPDSVLRFPPDFPRKAEGEPSSFVSLAASPDGGFALADGSTEYRIGIFDRTGRKLREITRDIPRVRRTKEEIAEEEQRLQRVRDRARSMMRLESRGGAAGALPAVSELRAHFLMNALRYDPAGRLWVRTERGGSRQTIFDVFDPAGRYLGETLITGRVGDFALGGDMLAAVTFDQDEAQYVTFFRVRG